MMIAARSGEQRRLHAADRLSSQVQAYADTNQWSGRKRSLALGAELNLSALSAFLTVKLSQCEHQLHSACG